MSILLGFIAWILNILTHRVTTLGMESIPVDPRAETLCLPPVPPVSLDTCQARAETLCLRVSLDTPAIADPLACATCGDLLCDAHLHLSAEPCLQCLRCLGATCAGDCANRARLAWLEQELTRLGAPAPTCAECSDPLPWGDETGDLCEDCLYPWRQEAEGSYLTLSIEGV